MGALLPPLDAEAQIKLALMRAIDADLKRRYRTLIEAADAIGGNLAWDQLSRIRNGRYEHFSLRWLLQLAANAQVHIRFHIDPVNR